MVGWRVVPQRGTRFAGVGEAMARPRRVASVMRYILVVVYENRKYGIDDIEKIDWIL